MEDGTGIGVAQMMRPWDGIGTQYDLTSEFRMPEIGVAQHRRGKSTHIATSSGQHVEDDHQNESCH